MSPLLFEVGKLRIRCATESIRVVIPDAVTSYCVNSVLSDSSEHPVLRGALGTSPGGHFWEVFGRI